jgi:hypothetical protein
MLVFLVYSVYIILSLLLTFYVGNRLNADGEVWLIHLFQAKEFAIQLNRLLLIGYYLVNIGYVFYSFVQWGTMNTPAVAIQLLSQKMGVICLILGYLHYQNILVISLLFNFNLLKKWKI